VSGETLAVSTLLIALGGLSGSVPYAYIIGRANGIDIREHGSGNVGATNVGRVLGRRLGLVCFALDVGKGFAPTLIFGAWAGALGRLEVDDLIAWLWVACAACCVLGHVFTPWLGFKGGKGVATGLGALLGVFPTLTIAALAGFALWLACMKVWRIVSLASIVAAASMPGVVALAFVIGGAPMRSATPFITLTGALAALVIVKHRSNIRRLLAGEEPRFGKKPADGDAG